VPGTFFFSDAGQAATPLAACEAKLLDQRVCRSAIIAGG
jgi:hypothetical protein